MLPSRATEQTLLLSLPNSKVYLYNLIALPRFKQRGLVSLNLPPLNNSTIEQVIMFTNRYFKLARLEKHIEKERTPAPTKVAECQARCQELADSIINLFTEVRDAYDSNPKQMSTFILNLFLLWV